MLEYNYHNELDITELNILSGQGWKVFELGNYDGVKFKDVIMVNGTDPVLIQTEQAILDLTQEKITENDREFYVDKTIGYGDILITTFLTIFLVFSIVGFLIKFFIPNFINFKRN